MVVGAVIVAAGRSSRMGDFKPLLKIGDKSFIGHIISTFASAGVKDVVIVTGREAKRLEEAVKAFPEYEQAHISFVENKSYETTEMLDSIKLGIGQINCLERKNTLDEIFITTTDIPLFTRETVEALINARGQIKKPSYMMKSGHPILIKADCVDRILEFQGQGGLKAAINSLGGNITYVEVKDQGILMDGDTPEDYERIRAYFEETYIHL